MNSKKEIELLNSQIKRLKCNYFSMLCEFGWNQDSILDDFITNLKLDNIEQPTQEYLDKYIMSIIYDIKDYVDEEERENIENYIENVISLYLKRGSRI